MDIQFPAILFQVINFGVVFGLLWYLLYRPILNIFSERSKRIAEGQKAAQKAIEQQEQIEQLKTKAIQEMKKESAKLLQKTAKEAEQEKLAIIAEARKQATKEIEKMTKTWVGEKEQMLGQMRQQLVGAVVTATERVLSQSLDKKTQAKLVDSELEKLLKAI